MCRPCRRRAVLPALAGCTKVDPPVVSLESARARDPHDFLLTGKEKTRPGTPSSRMPRRSMRWPRCCTPCSASLTRHSCCQKPGWTRAKSSWRPAVPAEMKRAASAVCTVSTGAHCHGISGDGAGPTAAFLNPYPRPLPARRLQVQEHGAGGQAHDRRSAPHLARRDCRHGDALVPAVG